MTQGIVIIAMGDEYEKLAAYTMAISSYYIKVPIAVLTNVKYRHEKWKDAQNIEFVYVDLPTDSNREVKNQLYKYSPFGETIYLDCDSVITRYGIENVFEFLRNNDFVFQSHSYWTEDKKYYRLYRDTAKHFGVKLPLRIYLGGFWAFRKSAKAIDLFNMWNTYWKEMGSGRDMAALACAVKNSGIEHSIIFKKEHKFFSFGMDADTIVVHRVHADDLLNYYNIPLYRQNKDFDIGNRSQWDMVNFND
jgi:hypothetical protein